MTALTHALAYAARGWHVHPVVPRGKRPLTQHGCKDATTDPGQIKAWWAKWPDANVGIATGEISGLWVLDIDAPKGGPGSLEDLQKQFSELPQTIFSKTGSGGWHYLWQHRPGIRNRAKIRPGIDVRGDGGYIVAPPSVHESGQAYIWWRYNAPLAPAPMWLLRLVSYQPPTRRRVRMPRWKDQDGARPQIDIAALPMMEKGDRSDGLIRIAGRLKWERRPDLEACIRWINQAKCRPPLSERELECTILRSVRRFEEG